MNPRIQEEFECWDPFRDHHIPGTGVCGDRRCSPSYIENFPIEPEPKIGTRSGIGQSGHVQVGCEKGKLFLREP